MNVTGFYKHQGVRFFIAVLIATVLALTAHIYVLRYTAHSLAALGLSGAGGSVPGFWVVVSAYITEFVDVALLAAIYYIVGDRLVIQSKFLKGVVLGLIICEVKGAFFREPLMNFIYRLSYGMPEPLKAALLIDLDKWIGNVLLGLVLVFFCPVKRDSV